MSDLPHIESLGIELPKGRAFWSRIEQAHSLGLLMSEEADEAKDALNELLAVIERLAGERDTNEDEAAAWQKCAEQAEAALAAMTEERDQWEWVARHRRALRVRGTVEFSWGWECVLRDEQPGENEVDWLLARYQPTEEPTDVL
jgi:hypothetical protein